MIVASRNRIDIRFLQKRMLLPHSEQPLEVLIGRVLVNQNVLIVRKQSKPIVSNY
jgi:hypothetical protein